MALTTQAGLIAALASGQQVQINKLACVPGQNAWGSPFNFGISPPGGTLAGTSTGAGVVPTDATTGFPTINAFAAGATGYVGSITYSASVGGAFGGCRFMLADMLFKAGAYAFNANVTLAAQPSYSSRIPGGDYKGTEIWIEGVTSFTGVPVITVTYTNQDGTTGRSTGAISLPSGFIVNRVYRLPLQSGDTGVQKIESVTCGTASAGTFNVLVIRPLWMTRLDAVATTEITHGPDKTDLPVVFADSALFVLCSSDFTNNGTPNFELLLNVING